MIPCHKIDVEAVLCALNAKQTGNGQYMALCPVHGDNNASLAVKVLGPFEALFYCHAGCTYKEIMKALITNKMLKGK